MLVINANVPCCQYWLSWFQHSSDFAVFCHQTKDAAQKLQYCQLTQNDGKSAQCRQQLLMMALAVWAALAFHSDCLYTFTANSINCETHNVSQLQ